MDHRIRENFKRSWCAQCRYDGLQEFIFGTVFADNEREALRAIEVALREVFPSLPQSIIVIPGAVFFIPREDS